MAPFKIHPIDLLVVVGGIDHDFETDEQPWYTPSGAVGYTDKFDIAAVFGTHFKSADMALREAERNGYVERIKVPTGRGKLRLRTHWHLSPAGARRVEQHFDLIMAGDPYGLRY